MTRRDGAGLAFYDSGRGGAVVLFVHGWQGDRTVWNDVIAALGPDLRTIAVDLRGSGDSSSVPGPYRLERFSADLQDLIEFLDVAPVVVVGHSMGAKVALRLAIDAPHMVQALALIAPVPASGAGFSEKGTAYLRATAGDPVAVKSWLARTLSSAAQPAVLELLCAAAARTPRDAALESFESWALADIAEETKAITVPTVVIAPEDDQPERARAKVTELITGALHVVLPGESHYAIVERPSAIAGLIRGFIRAYDFAK